MIESKESILRHEYSEEFDQLRKNRMVVSYFKYGRASDNYPLLVDSIANAKIRIQKFEETGNLEYLLDASNQLMLEYMFPRHPKAHFEAKDGTDNLVGDPVKQWGTDHDRP